MYKTEFSQNDLDVISSSAVKGVIEAQVLAGFLAQFGIERSTDKSEAFDLFLKAANGGSSLAQFMVGLAYSRKEGIDNQREADEWFLESAQSGCALAQFSLGIRYREGRFVDQDDNAAVHWFKLAAEQDQAKSLFWLGRHYYEGRGVPKDLLIARHYFERASINTRNQYFQDYIQTFLTRIVE